MANIETPTAIYLSELDSLAAGWRKYVNENPAPDDMTRPSGYVSGVRLCAKQLEETIARMRADAEA